ncbi:MAG: ribonuclease R [Eubacteriales bacterium]|nr:ribonuclease R [Eubacteriales bacterium]
MKNKQVFEKRKKFIMELLSDPLYKPMRLRELGTLLSLKKPERKELFDILEELSLEGKVSMDAKGRYSKVSGKYGRKIYGNERNTEGPLEKKEYRPGRNEKYSEKKSGKKNPEIEGTIKEGVFIGHPKGFGFVEIEGEDEDVFIPEEDTGTAMHQDRVRIVIKDGGKDGKRREGIVTKVLERGMTEIVGTFQSNRDYGFVVSDNPKFSRDIFIPRKESKGVRNGDKVIAAVTDYGSKNKSPEGRITEILGNIRTPGTDILAIVKSFGIPCEFPEKVLNQAMRVPDHVLDADRNGRLDLCHLQTVTIDGEDAKDLDDAISLTKENGHYHLGVHIADVSNYVQGGSALDREALKRGTSVYLADRVIPMLPERLSNGICSLNQGEDRLALSCLMEIDESGAVVDHKIAETVIRVDERMSYTDVKNILEDTDPQAKARYEELVPMFFLMKELSELIRSSRHSRGSIDFDFPESKIILNAAGRAIDVKPYEANAATRIIEDFMLLANETVAKEYCKGEYPFVYRTHENPDSEKVESLLTLIRNQGIPVQKSGKEISPKEIQEILEKIQGLPNEPMLSRLILRTMKQARYTTECSGHFGLAAKYYCHFTSPIRRYPDLQIHRIIKDNLRGRLEREGKTEHYREILDEVARQSSVCERRADEAERESDKLKKAEYMSYHLGETFEGIISGVTGWGFYVELPNTVEGLVHVNTLWDDYYTFDQGNCELRGDMTGKVYRLGQKVRVRVEDADPLMKTIDFVIERDF